MRSTGRWMALALTLALGACAANGTRVTTNSESWRTMAGSQQWWCGSMQGCDCAMDGQKVTCALVQSCLSSGNCQAAK